MEPGLPRNFRTCIIKRGRNREAGVVDVISELTNQILLPKTRIVADSAFSGEWRCVHANSLCFG